MIRVWCLAFAGIALVMLGGRAMGDGQRPASDADRAFWTWFAGHAGQLQKMKPVELMNSVQRELDNGHRGIIAEIGMEPSGFLLVLSADGVREVFPAVQQLFAARPAITGWRIVAFRQRDTDRPMAKIAVNGLSLDPETIRYTAVRNGDKLDVRFYLPPAAGDGDVALMMLYLALDHTVGEYDAETKIGGIDHLPSSRAPSTARPLTDLPAEADALPRQP